MTLDALAGWSAWISGGLGAVVVAALAWIGGASRTRRQLSSDATAVRADEADRGTISRLERTVDELQADFRREHEERLAVERAAVKVERQALKAQSDLRAALRDISMLRRKLERVGVPDSDYEQLLETNFGDLPDVDGS
jgi:hypothetical protein